MYAYGRSWHPSGLKRMILASLICRSAGSFVLRRNVVSSPCRYIRSDPTFRPLLPTISPIDNRYDHVGHLSSRHMTSFGRNENETPQPMMNLYQEWTLDQDELLWERRTEPLPVLASLLGRGLRGVESRLAKLSDVNSPAYQRLFCNDETWRQDQASKKLVPAGEILRRIQWDYNLDERDFVVLHYDRVEDKTVETSMDTPNTSVAGDEERFVFAIPEHRITQIKFRERVVWDRERKIDCVFGSMNGKGETIDHVMKGYDEWKRQRDEEMEWNRHRQREVSGRINQILGDDRYALLKDLSSNILHAEDGSTPTERKVVQQYVQSCLQLFREVRNDPNSSLSPSWIPLTDEDALAAVSDLAAFLPNEPLRVAILTEIDSQLPKQAVPIKKYILPELREEDLTETFVRGSGAGGQKINKTNNRVVLVHNPTEVRVECQETRSLQQNRKIARKRLRLKVDEYLNGNQSKERRLADKRVLKKSRSKARNRARQRKKKATAAASREEN